MDYKLFINGGYVRDELMGIPSNDMDYTVVIQNIDEYDSAGQAYDLFVRHIKDEGWIERAVTDWLAARSAPMAVVPEVPANDRIYNPQRKLK